MVTRMILVVGMVVMLGSPPAHAGVWGTIWSGAGSVVSTSVSVGHQGLHFVQNIAGGLMGLTHTALDVLNIPWENGDSE